MLQMLLQLLAQGGISFLVGVDSVGEELVGIYLARTIRKGEAVGEVDQLCHLVDGELGLNQPVGICRPFFQIPGRIDFQYVQFGLRL